MLALLLLLTACSTPDPSEPVEPAGERAGWLEMAEGTPVYRYDMVPLGERDQELQLVPDLVIEERVGDPRYSFGEAPPTLAVDGEGRLFVYDASNYRVAVFGADGEFSHEFGGHGGGPGEFSFAQRGPILLLGDVLWVFNGYRRIGLWTPEGDFLGIQEHGLRNAGVFVPQDDGTILASTLATLPPGVVRGGRGWTHPAITLARYAPNDVGLERLAEYVSVPAWLRPTFTGSSDGRAYVATIQGHETQVAALRSDATVRWITLLRQPPGATIMPTELLLDGTGHVFVMPRLNRIEAPSATVDRLIEVLDADGARLASLTIPDQRIAIMWQVARREFVYGVQADPTTFEWEVVRYRIVVP